jgi:uncharacterized integral membrane protein
MTIPTSHHNDRESPPRQGDERQRDDMRRLADLTSRREGRHPVVLGLVVGAVLSAGAAFLIAQNTQTVAFDWLWVSFDAALWAALLVSFLAGAIASPLLLLWSAAARTRRRKVRALLDRVRDEARADAPPVSRPTMYR